VNDYLLFNGEGIRLCLTESVENTVRHNIFFQKAPKMIRSISSSLIMVFIVLSSFLSGCGQKYPPGMAKPYPTIVIVKYGDGTPLGGAKVVFTPKDTAQVGGKWSISATTDKTGKAELYTDGVYKGVPAGSYTVTVSKIDLIGDPPPPNPMNAEEKKAFDEYMRSGKKQERVSVVADKYGDVKSTPLTVEIKKSKNEVPLEIGDAVKIPKPLHRLM